MHASGNSTGKAIKALHVGNMLSMAGSIMSNAYMWGCLTTHCMHLAAAPCHNFIMMLSKQACSTVYDCCSSISITSTPIAWPIKQATYSKPTHIEVSDSGDPHARY